MAMSILPLLALAGRAFLASINLRRRCTMPKALRGAGPTAEVGDATLTGDGVVAFIAVGHEGTLIPAEQAQGHLA